MSKENLDGRLVLVLCNKERKLAGFQSQYGRCASPVEATFGERVTVPGIDCESERAAIFAENKIEKPNSLQ